MAHQKPYSHLETYIQIINTILHVENECDVIIFPQNNH